MKTRAAHYRTGLLALISCGALLSPSITIASEWGYQGKHGVDSWGAISATCSDGKNQSPIDINSNVTIDASLANLAMNYSGQVSDIVNNGHTVQVNVTGENTLSIDGDTFALKQFHFHTPSENTLNGKHSPLEAHFVHANSDNALAVVSVFYQAGLREDSALKQVLSNIPNNNQTIQPSASITLDSLLPRVRSYYRFSGSLTTPPCSEGVRWFVLKDKQTADQQEIDQLKAIMGNNARPTQPIHARKVLQ
ncbi:carbonic anhydrase [Vibrio nomapromontoriensis]|uniref:carbonic anhydrase n=1 Tax=Vibrio nomapromontoriensis TaxID=2910246 RepID=UPI003D0ECF27